MLEDSRQRTIISHVNKVWKKSVGKKQCLHPEAPMNCSSTYGRAHSVQRSKLKRIAESGKVHKVATDPMTGSHFVDRVGIKKASAFFGFCNFHDNKLFAPIEKTTLALNNETALLLVFRGMSIHMYYKRRRNETDLFRTLPSSLVPAELVRHDKLIRDGLHRLLRFAEPTYERMGRALLQRNFSGARYFAFILNTIPDILCSEASIINFGFDGSLVREKPQPYDFMTLSLLPYKQHFGIAVFAWYGKCQTNENFLKSLLSLRECEIPDAIVRFAFRYLNNFFFAPIWWKRLSVEKQNCLLNKAIDRNILVDLAADGNNYVDWKVTDIKTNLNL